MADISKLEEQESFADGYGDRIVEWELFAVALICKELGRIGKMTPEQAKNAKKYTKTGTKKPTVYKFDTEKAKSRKKDDEKGEFISKIAEFIGKFVQNVEIVNAEREISFEIGENSYSLTLTKHRKAKK